MRAVSDYSLGEQHEREDDLQAERMQASEFTELEAPAFFYSEKEVEAVVLGRVLYRDDQRPLVLALEDRPSLRLFRTSGRSAMILSLASKFERFQIDTT